jgi:hypothetical protein
MEDASSRTPLRLCLVVFLLVLCGGVVARTGGWFARPAAAGATGPAVVADDAGDQQATTTYDGPLVRKRAAIAIHPVAGTDEAKITREVQAAARAARIGALEPATFAVFSEEMLTYLVPELTLVAPEDVPVATVEALMRDHQPAGVAFYLVQPVLVHDLTFAAVPAKGVTPRAAQAYEDREGVLTDSLGRYVTTVQPAGVTVRYFGALLSDGQIATVREAMGRAGRVPAAQVEVEPNQPGPGVDLSTGVRLVDDETTRHSH